MRGAVCSDVCSVSACVAVCVCVCAGEVWVGLACARVRVREVEGNCAAVGACRRAAQTLAQ